MYVQIQGRADIRMSQQYAYRLVVASAFYAPCGETVAETVEQNPKSTRQQTSNDKT